MSHTRSREVIIADILKLVLEPRLKTHVMFKANLSFGQSTYYLQLMSSSGLIKNSTDGKWFATEKGRMFLRLHEQAEFLLKETTPQL